LVIGLFNNLQLGTTINYNTVAGLHTLQTLHYNLFTLSSVVFTYLQRGSYPSLTESHTPNVIVLQNSQVLKSHSRSPHGGFSVIVHYRGFFFPRSRFAHYNCTRRLLHFNCLTAAHTHSYKPLVGQWTTCLISLLHCHLVYRLPSSSRYTVRLLSDVVFTGVVRQRCQSCLLLLSNQRASTRLGSLRLYSAWHGETPL
jgi:hypothetical protein